MKRPSSGPRELTPTIVRSIEEADKPAKRGMKTDTQKDGPVSKPTKGKTPKKRKSNKAATSQAQPKKQKKPARRLILQSSSDLDSEYVPPKHKNASPSESESESSDDEASGRGDTLPRSPTLEIPVRSHPPSPPPVAIPAAAAKNAQTVNASVENLQQSLQSERSNLEAARLAIEAANETLHANVNDRLNQLEAELAVENRIMDELDRRTSQLKMKNYKLRTATTEVNDLKSEREVIRSSAADVHSILLHLLEAHDPIITITIRRHLADKLKPALDILSRIEGVPVSGVQPKQWGEKVTTQPPSGPKPSTEPKGNEASVSNKEKKKKKIGEDDTDNEDDVYVENSKNPFQKVKPSEKEMEESYKKQKAELEQKQKEAELLEKKKSMFPVWTIDSL
ncbi:unnamed protein product [Lactuca saligna]|uniref:Uncharacterized protein n=1 Tax=Lactuca saligna TaxID=75948 RepID=A0AA35V3K7_LACSI|nr:unnamed protein product [Lactuca saligna]